MAPAVATPPAPPVTPTTTTPPPGPPRDGRNVSACTDGTCQVELTGRTTMRIQGSRGRARVEVEPFAPDGVRITTSSSVFEATGQGSEFGLSEGVRIVVVRSTGTTAVLDISRT